jgi:hypothetical protein
MGIGPDFDSRITNYLVNVGATEKCFPYNAVFDLFR